MKDAVNKSTDVPIRENVYGVTEKETEQYRNLCDLLAEQDRLAVAFSGGVDSTFLLKVAHDVCGNGVLALTASSCTFPQREVDEAVAFCGMQGIDHVVFSSEELDIEGFSDNPPDRCYLCKKELYGKMTALCQKQGIEMIVDGTNADDLSDYRPGQQAKQEYGIRSPLCEVGLGKPSIRALSHMLGLETYDKQSFACLASRIPYGDPITPDILAAVDSAEQFLLDRGFRQVRVRVHKDSARIELAPDQITDMLAMSVREETSAYLKKLGFRYVSLDLEGYRSGSMNEALQ